MVGFNVQINDEKKLHGDLDCTLLIVDVTLNNGSYKCRVHFEGNNQNSEERHIWFDSPVANDSQVVIDFQDILNSSKTVSTKTKISGQEANAKVKLQRYYKLKKELEEKNLI